jgi:hypothetical protein
MPEQITVPKFHQIERERESEREKLDDSQAEETQK